MEFVLVVFKLLIFKVCGILGISKVELFKFSGTQKVKKNQKKKKKSEYFFVFFTEALTVSLPVLCWTEDNADLHSSSNISKTVNMANMIFTETISQEHSVSFLMVCSLLDCVLKL